eukprot:ctg_2406.g551
MEGKGEHFHRREREIGGAATTKRLQGSSATRKVRAIGRSDRAPLRTAPTANAAGNDAAGGELSMGRIRHPRCHEPAERLKNVSAHPPPSSSPPWLQALDEAVERAVSDTSLRDLHFRALPSVYAEELDEARAEWQAEALCDRREADCGPSRRIRESCTRAQPGRQTAPKEAMSSAERQLPAAADAFESPAAIVRKTGPGADRPIQCGRGSAGH